MSHFDDRILKLSSIAGMNFYKRSMQTNPLLTKCIITGFTLGAGDVIAQQLDNEKKYNAERTLKMTAFGFFAVGPAVVTWMNILDKVRVANFYTTLGIRLALDQIVWTPIFLTGFLTGMSVLEGHTFGQAKKKLENKFFDTIKASWAVWIPVQSINLSLVPVTHRPVVIQVVALGWNTFLSFINYK